MKLARRWHEPDFLGHGVALVAGWAVSWLAKLAIAAAIFAAGAMAGVKIHAGLIAQRDLEVAEAQKSDALQQRKFSDKAAGQHAGTVAKLSNQLGDAREKISQLTGRECLDADTVRVLNAIGGEPGGAAAGEPAGTAEAIAGNGGIRFTTDRDAAGAIATCRAFYGEVSSQLNQILDIEDKRHPPGAGRGAMTAATRSISISLSIFSTQ
ncbi:hypothetical protein LP416_27775 [Polaromonas sp. P2-4]|nr:hypothetical protein LP416_27775 [Polaromonas sp. P2-4]